MSSNTEFPDLIRRAAAHLGGQPRAPEPLPRNEALQDSPPAHVEPEPRPAAPRPAPAPVGRSVNISSTALAAKGIALPSSGAGYELTIEEFRGVKRHVLANITRASSGPASAASRLVLVTSARPGDGKTFTSINLALALAYERDRRVLLIDGDGHRQTLMSDLGISAENGWIDILAEKGVKLEDVLLNVNVPNLSVLPAGHLTQDLPELLASKKMVAFLNQLYQADPDRIIIIDSLPCMVSNEPAILAGYVGQTIFVVSADETSREEVQASLGQLGACATVSLVLNKSLPLLSGRFARYGYGYDYQNRPR